MELGIVVQVVAFATAIAAAVLAARKAPAEGRKLIAEAGQINTAAQAVIIDDLQSELNRVRKQCDDDRALFKLEIAALQEQNELQKNRLTALQTQLDMGHRP